MLTAFPYPKVMTSKVADFTFGLITGKSLANIAALEDGTPEPIWIGRKKFYDARDLADWLRRRYPEQKSYPGSSNLKYVN
jgi:hypothetical protein